ncbi:AGRB2-like protein [Mya arenaria]|uniref:AGRB2-like protein n=1 Tax=Mya arenaria TaxID=6604 RepID=A0ABY7DNZ0_MYAAR|nr:AGRB2-like protein [Mya arenaria]
MLGCDFLADSVESGVIRAFVGPALAIITINAVILVVVMKTMFGSHAISQKSTSGKSKMAIRCLLILLPLTGITWLLGLYVNKKHGVGARKSRKNSSSLTNTQSSTFESEEKQNVYSGVIITSSKINENDDKTSSTLQTDTPSSEK